MAAVTLSRADLFGPSKKVKVFSLPASLAADLLRGNSGNPEGWPGATKLSEPETNVAGELEVTGMTVGVRYLAAAEVGGTWRYLMFSPPEAAASAAMPEVSFGVGKGGQTVKIAGSRDALYSGEIEGEPDIEVEDAPPAGQVAELTLEWVVKVEGGKPKSIKAPAGGSLAWVGGTEPAWDTTLGAKNVASMLVRGTKEVLALA